MIGKRKGVKEAEKVSGTASRQMPVFGSITFAFPPDKSFSRRPFRRERVSQQTPQA